MEGMQRVGEAGFASHSRFAGCEKRESRPMKKVVCPGPECQERRKHHERQDEPRGPQMVEVPDDRPDHRPAFCSMTCALMSGYTTLHFVTEENACPKCLAQGIKVMHGKDYQCREPEVGSLAKG